MANEELYMTHNILHVIHYMYILMILYFMFSSDWLTIQVFVGGSFDAKPLQDCSI